MNPTELIKELNQGKFRPVYYFFGSEEYRIKEAEKETVRRFLPAALRKTNHKVLSAAKSKPEDIIAELSVYPMLGEKQAFTINDIQTLKKPQLDKILGMLKPPDPDRTVILITPQNKEPGKKTKLFQYLTENTAAVAFGKITRVSALKRLKAIFDKREIEIEDDALEMLSTLSGGALGAIILEADKLSDYAGEGGKITTKEVAEVSSDFQGFKIYELADYIASKETDRALGIIDFLLRAGESGSGILYFIGEHFVDLYLAKNNKSLGPGRKHLAWKYKNQINRFENDQLRKIIGLITTADRDLRSGLRAERTILEKLIIEITGLDKG